MTAFADDFRAEIATEYDALLNDRTDGLAKARRQGTHALADWIRRRVSYDLQCAFYTSNPGDVDRACARGALALLMLRDASRAMGLAFYNAYEGPESERKAKLDRIYEDHARRLKGVLLPPPSFEAMLAELSGFGDHVTIDVTQTGYTVSLTSWRDKAAPPRTYDAASIVGAVTLAHAAEVDKTPACRTPYFSEIESMDRTGTVLSDGTVIGAPAHLYCMTHRTLGCNIQPPADPRGQS